MNEHIEDVHVEAILHVIIAHETEDIIVDIAEVVDLTVVNTGAPAQTLITYIWFNSPILIVIRENGMLVEEPTVLATHMMVADHPSFAHANRSKILKTVHESAFVNPIWQ